MANTIIQSHIQLKYYAITDPGCRRSNNEDNFLVDEEDYIFAVADGVGGLEGGEIASRLALDEFQTCFKKSRRDLNRVTTRIAKATARANSAVFEYGCERGKRIATTLSLIYLKGWQAYIVNVGDSRVYLWRDKVLSQLTVDHTIKQEMVIKGLLDPDGSSPPGISHVITRAVGAEIDIDADIFTHSIERGDTYLICTDGITTMLSDEEIQQAMAGTPDIKHVGEDLLEQAKSAGGFDNITLVLLTII